METISHMTAIKTTRKTSNKISRQISNQITGWDEAILDAENEIRDLQGRIAGLRGSIRIFKLRRAEKEPFPAKAEDHK